MPLPFQDTLLYKYFHTGKIQDFDNVISLSQETNVILIKSTGGYLVTQKDVFFDRTRFCQLASALLSSNDTNIKLDLPPPAIIKVRKSL